VSHALSLLRAARLILETEGCKAFFRHGFSFVLSRFFQYQVYYVYRRVLADETHSERAGLLPQIDNFDFRIVQSNDDADELERCGLEFRSQVLSARKRLDKGAVAFVGFGEKRVIHICWVALDERAQRAQGQPPYSVDFTNREVCYTGMWTYPQYRRRGLRRYTSFRMLEFLLERGFRIGKGIEARGNRLAELSHSEFDELYAEGRHLKVLW